MQSFNEFSNKDFVAEPKIKTILSYWAIEEEVRLNVDKDPKFANRAKQTSSSFYYDATGINNGCYDKTIYQLEESFIGTRWFFAKYTSIDSRFVNGSGLVSKW